MVKTIINLFTAVFFLVNFSSLIAGEYQFTVINKSGKDLCVTGGLDALKMYFHPKTVVIFKNGKSLFYWEGWVTQANLAYVVTEIFDDRGHCKTKSTCIKASYLDSHVVTINKDRSCSIN